MQGSKITFGKQIQLKWAYYILRIEVFNNYYV